jgi:hypothetical protein
MMLLQIQKSIPDNLRSEMVGGLILKPCSVQTVADIAEKIHAYPKQELKNFGTDSALTFVDRESPNDDRQAPHTLAEFFDIEHVNHFFIYTKGNGHIAIERLTNGDFVIIASFEEKERDSEAIRATMPATVSD